MTHAEIRHPATTRVLENSYFLSAGFQHIKVEPGAASVSAAMMELGALQVLAAWLAVGSKEERAFARIQVKKYIAEGKRLQLAKAITVPKCHRGDVNCQPTLTEWCAGCENLPAEWKS